MMTAYKLDKLVFDHCDLLIKRITVHDFMYEYIKEPPPREVLIQKIFDNQTNREDKFELVSYNVM